MQHKKLNKLEYAFSICEKNLEEALNIARKLADENFDPSVSTTEIWWTIESLDTSNKVPVALVRAQLFHSLYPRWENHTTSPKAQQAHRRETIWKTSFLPRYPLIAPLHLNLCLKFEQQYRDGEFIADICELTSKLLHDQYSKPKYPFTAIDIDNLIRIYPLSDEKNLIIKYLASVAAAYIQQKSSTGEHKESKGDDRENLVVAESAYLFLIQNVKNAHQICVQQLFSTDPELSSLWRQDNVPKTYSAERSALKQAGKDSLSHENTAWGPEDLPSLLRLSFRLYDANPTEQSKIFAEEKFLDEFKGSTNKKKFSYLRTVLFLLIFAINTRCDDKYSSLIEVGTDNFRLLDTRESKEESSNQTLKEFIEKDHPLAIYLFLQKNEKVLSEQTIFTLYLKLLLLSLNPAKTAERFQLPEDKVVALKTVECKSEAIRHAETFFSDNKKRIVELYAEEKDLHTDALVLSFTKRTGCETPVANYTAGIKNLYPKPQTRLSSVASSMYATSRQTNQTNTTSPKKWGLF